MSLDREVWERALRECNLVGFTWESAAGARVAVRRGQRRWVVEAETSEKATPVVCDSEAEAATVAVAMLRLLDDVIAAGSVLVDAKTALSRYVDLAPHPVGIGDCSVEAVLANDHLG